MNGIISKLLSVLNSTGGFWLSFTIKSTVLLLLALMITQSMRKSTPTIRHIIWTIAFVAILIFPIVTLFIPVWNPALITIQQNKSVKIDVISDLPIINQAESKLQSFVENNQLANGGNSANGQFVVEFEFDRIRKSRFVNGLFFFFEKNGTSLLIFVWFIGMVLFALRHIASRLMLKSFVITSEEISDQSWMDLWVRIRKRVRITRPVQLYSNEELITPLTAGFIWPKIIIPKEADDWDSEQRKYVLMHELAHIVRWDAVSQFLAYMVCGIMWFNPIAWFAYRQMIKERELACDEFVVQSGSKATDYADFLLRIAQRLPSLRLATVSTVPMAKTSQLEGRLLSILNPEKKGGLFIKAGTILAIIVFVGLLIPITAVNPFYFESSSSHALDQGEVKQFKKENLERLLSDMTPKQNKKVLEISHKKDSLKISNEFIQNYKSIKDSSLEKRLQTLWGFLENKKCAGPALVLALKDEDWEIRKVAAWALGNLKNEQSVSALLETITDENRDVRYSAIEALGKIKSPKAITDLAHALKDEHWWIRRKAAWALGEPHDPSAITLLANSINDENAKVRHEVIDALGKIKDKRAIPFILQAIHDENRDVREVVVTALDEFGDSSVLPVLNEALNDKSAGVRREAAETMGELKDPIALPYLRNALNDNDKNVRQRAAWALGEIGNPAALKYLTVSLNDGHKVVRIESINALVRIHTDSAHALILAKLDDKEWDVRKAAVTALGKIGNKQTIPALNKAIRDKNINVSWEAAKAIKEIQEKG